MRRREGRPRRARDDAPHSPRSGRHHGSRQKTACGTSNKYDIPVLKIDGVYWTKHRVTSKGDARASIDEAPALLASLSSGANSSP